MIKVKQIAEPPEIIRLRLEFVIFTLKHFSLYKRLQLIANG